MSHKLPQLEALNQMIGSFESKINDLKTQQNQLADTAANANILTLSASPEETYSKLGDTLQTALSILNDVKAQLEAAPDADTYAAASSLITSIQHLFGEFTSIWKRQLELQNKLTLEEIRQRNRLALEEHKMNMRIKYHNEVKSIPLTNDPRTGVASTDVVPFSTKDFMASAAALDFEQ